MEFPAKMIGQTFVVVVDSKVRGTNFADPQFLLLVAAGWH